MCKKNASEVEQMTKDIDNVIQDLIRRGLMESAIDPQGQEVVKLTPDGKAYAASLPQRRSMVVGTGLVLLVLILSGCSKAPAPVATASGQAPAPYQARKQCLMADSPALRLIKAGTTTATVEGRVGLWVADSKVLRLRDCEIVNLREPAYQR